MYFDIDLIIFQEQLHNQQIYIGEMQNYIQAQQAIEQLRVKLQEDAVRQNIKRKSQLFPNPEPSSQDEAKKETPIINLFVNSNKRQQKPLFAENDNGGINLFKMNPKNQNNKIIQGAKNIFNLAAKPAIENEEISCNNQENSDKMGLTKDESPSKRTVFKTEPDQKIMKYEYQKEFEKMCEFPLKKFKLGAQAPKQQIYVTVEKGENQSGVLHLFIRNCITKIVVFNGVLINNISNFENFMNKPDILKFYIVRKNKNGSEQERDKATKQIVKLQFVDEQAAEEFKAKVKEAYRS